jgi:hypothetical protein
LTLPGPIVRNDSKKDSYKKVVESKENIEVDDGKKHKIISERTERHTSRRGKDD